MSKRYKICTIVAVSLILIGCIIFGGVMTVLKWDFKKLSTAKYETNEYSIGEDFKDISITTNTADITFLPSENAQTKIICHEQSTLKHSVAVKDGTLSVEVIDTRQWYDYIGINFETPKITVYIPSGEYGALKIKTSTGSIDAADISADSAEFSVTTGEITATNLKINGDIKTSVSTGKTNITDMQCNNFTSDGNTGNIILKNTIAKEKISVKRSTGNVKFESCDANEILITTDTGSVTGSLISEKVFIAKTDTGHINVPKTTGGGRCEITTDTGNIKITVIGD